MRAIALPAQQREVMLPVRVGEPGGREAAEVPGIPIGTAMRRPAGARLAVADAAAALATLRRPRRPRRRGNCDSTPPMLPSEHARRRGAWPACDPEDPDLSLSASAAMPAALPPEPAPGTDLPPAEVLLARILQSLDDDKAEEVVAIDLRGRSTIADHMVICSGRSARQVGAIAEKLVERLKGAFGIVPRLEGKETGDWVLIDAGDVIVHVFRPEVRSFYQLEKLWMPAAARAAASAPSAAAPGAGAAPA